MPWIDTATLEGDHVRLEPLRSEHVDALWAAGNHAAIWQYMPLPVTSRAEMAFLVEYVNGAGQGFATVDRATGHVVGSTSYLAPDEGNRRVEIGATWITPAWQRSPVNTEAKLLQLVHAFEVLGCNRVEFKTDARNIRSRSALARIGATEEGTLRSHMTLPDGHLRDSVYFSITRRDWPRVRVHLESMVSAYPEFTPPADW